MNFDPIQYDTMSDAMWFTIYDRHMSMMHFFIRFTPPVLENDYFISMHAHHLKQMEHRALLAELRRVTIECLTKSNGAPDAPPSRT